MRLGPAILHSGRENVRVAIDEMNIALDPRSDDSSRQRVGTLNISGRLQKRTLML
jgi:hypothetical protein